MPASLAEHPAWARLGVTPDARLGARHLFQLAELARERPDDPIPHLIMAQTYLERHSFSNAQTRYEWAYRASPEARHEPSMLPNLLVLLGRAESTQRAAALIQRAYGSEALVALDEALSRQRPGSYTAGRLQTVRRKIEAMRR